VSPSFVRVELPGGTVTTTSVTIRSHIAAKVIAAETDCRCLSVTTPMPVTLTPDQPVPLMVRIAGVTSGIERITLRTTAGVERVEIQVVTAGLGQGKDVFDGILRTATAAHEHLLVVVHDLQGSLRNCGCSHGSLGGIDHLAALPAYAHSQAPDVSICWVLSGDIDGQHLGVGTALTHCGWLITEPSVVVANDPTPFLVTPGITAIVTTGPSMINHRRIVRPVGSGGMTMTVLRLDDHNLITNQTVVPIDATLPADASVLAAFPRTLSAQIITDANLTTACATCHQTAHTAWSTSAHASAWKSLKPADLIDDCVSCHSTALPSDSSSGQQRLAPGVSCQACHQGAEAHALAPVTVRTSGATDCRSCHNARHDPAFQREKAWTQIVHGP